jgi:hypothetical protein
MNTKKVGTSPVEQADFFNSLHLGHPGVVMAPARCGASAVLVSLGLPRSDGKARGYTKPTPWPQK